jgi:hypothetical protein
VTLSDLVARIHPSAKIKAMRLPVSAASLALLLSICLGISDLRLSAADNVDVCEVLQHPQSFNGKMISIRTRIRAVFEDFEVDTPSCPKKVTDGIWLEYGKGPKTQPVTWCCGDLTPGDQLDLIQDSAFLKFDSYLRSVRKGKPLYTVSATLFGRFETVPTTTCPDGVHQCPRDGGFGHFGMSASRLIIHSVSEVSAVKAH